MTLSLCKRCLSLTPLGGVADGRPLEAELRGRERLVGGEGELMVTGRTAKMTAG